MSSLKLLTVCSYCFSSSNSRSHPRLSTEQCKNRNDRVCKRCRKIWSSINVTQSPAENTWYQIRARPNKHKTILCKAILNGKLCPTGVDCKFPHNFIEKEAWESATENSLTAPSNKEKFYCFVCKLSFQSQGELSGHMNSSEHEKSAEKMRVLPSVGSNMDFKGTVRDRPYLSPDADKYQMCEYVAKNVRCRFKNACKFAHSKEEMTAWNEALQAELLKEDTDVFSDAGQDSWEHNGDTRRGTCLVIPGRDSTPSTPHGTPTKGMGKHKGKRIPQTSITSPTRHPSIQAIDRYKISSVEPQFIKRINRVIAKNGINAYLNAVPKHIRLQCDKQTDVSINSTETQELTWKVRLTTCQEEQLHAVILYNHKKCFRIGQILLGDVAGNIRELHTQLSSDSTGCILDVDLSSSMFIEVSVVFRPQKGEYNVCLVFQLIYGTLIPYNIRVRVVEERFVAPTAEFNALVQKEKVAIQQIHTHMNVLWEQEYKIVPFPGQRDAKTLHNTKHAIPSKIEGKIASGVYLSMAGITADSYKDRFHSLLYLEEYEHRKRLVKYDLSNYKVTYETAGKQVSYSNIEGDRIKTAPDNFRYITFKLKYNLFEGYRSYKPPTNAFVIPNSTHTAFECSHFHTGLDFMHFQIAETAVTACEQSGGLALVRFTPDRDEYVKMHDALDKIDPGVVFPKLRKVSIRSTWDEKSILDRADKEDLSESQRTAINSIINTKFQSFPTLICGPFGCGKTRTLSIAARLVALNYHGSRVLVVTRNNSCANLCVEEISRKNDFDSITSYRGKMTHNPDGIRPILFRHFAKSTNLGRNKRAIEYTQFNSNENGAKTYKMLQPKELFICGIIVTTTHGCYSLIQLKEQLGADAQSLFTHVFIDEAAQIIEPEACIPLHFASPDTKVVLAGDTCQTRPLVLSPLAVMHCMDKPVLERYYEFGEYESDELSVCRVDLRENFRSQEPIVRFLSRLFYNDSITANPPEVPGPHKLPYMSMVHVNGEEKRIELYGHVSYCNEIEGQQTLSAVQRFVDAGVDPSRIVVLSTYRRQLKLVEAYLRGNGVARCRRLGHHMDRNLCRQSRCVNDKTVEYRRLEGIQGLEYDVLIINTVRTIHEAPIDTSLETQLDLGLLDDVTQFNTILTRARGWVMVIGDTECLTGVGRCSEMWRQYLEACKEQGGYFPQGNIEHGTHDRLFERDRVKSEGIGTGRDSSRTRAEEKNSLLDSFKSICNEELRESTDDFRTIQVISEQLDLIGSLRKSVDKQSKQSKEEIQLFNARNIRKYTQHSYPINPTPSQPYRPQLTTNVPISSYAGAVNHPRYAPIPARPYTQAPSWTHSVSGAGMDVFPPRGFNQQSRESYY